MSTPHPDTPRARVGGARESIPHSDTQGARVGTFGFPLAGAGQAVLAVARVCADAALHGGIEATWLCGTEHLRSSRFAVTHARADFLAGRVAAKTAARVLAPHLPPPAAWEIVPGEHQQPRLRHVAPGLAVTLAHAGGVGLALVFSERVRCGLDLEPEDREAGEVIATQVAPSEAAWASAGGVGERMRWLLLWTAREAQGKSLGTGLLEPDRLVATEAWTERRSGWQARLEGNETHLVCAVNAGGMVISLLMPAGTDLDPLATWLSENPILARGSGE